MTTHGATWCEDSEGAESGAWYYDGLKVFKQIRDYTGNATWDTCVTHFGTFYKNLVDTQQSPGPLAGRRAFAQGFELMGDTDYIAKMIDNVTYSGLFHNCSDPDSSHSVWPSSTNSGPSRELAYLLTNILAAGRNALTSPFSVQDIDPADQCTNLGNSHTITSVDVLAFVKWHVDRYTISSTYIQPFMAALSASALIEYETQHPGVDVAVPALVKGLADFLWTNTWQSTPKKFQYCHTRSDGSHCLVGDDGEAYSVDLNLLIAPMYAWLYKEGYGQTYADRFDEIFISGVTGASLGFQGKGFSQNYKESFKALEWRGWVP